MPNLPRRLDLPGPLVDYLGWMRTLGKEMEARASQTEAAVRRIFASEDGVTLMNLLERATVDYALHPLSDPRACEALNAQRQIALDLRRIASNDGRSSAGGK